MKHPALQLAAVQTLAKITYTSKQQQQYLNGIKKNCTFSKTHINEVIRFLANTARYSPPTFFTMESTKYKTGSFSADGAWSNRELNKFRTQQGLKKHFRTNIRTQRSTRARPVFTKQKSKSLRRAEGGETSPQDGSSSSNCRNVPVKIWSKKKTSQFRLHPKVTCPQRFKNLSKDVKSSFYLQRGFFL